MNSNFSLPPVFTNFGDFSTSLHRSSNMPVKDSSLKSDVYKPKTLLPADTKLKFSLAPGDNRYLSVAKDLLPAAIDGFNGIGTTSDSDYDDYRSSILEIDAYNFQYEYLAMNLNKKNSPNIDIMAGLWGEGTENLNNSIAIAKERKRGSFEEF